MPPTNMEMKGSSASVPVALLLADDTCDRCGPFVPANTAVKLHSGGRLTFCNHCYGKHAQALVEFIAAIGQNKVK